MAENDKAITYSQYWKQIAEIRKDLLNEYKKYGTDTDPDEWVNDNLHQMIDGHQWIIYTWYNAQVLMHSANEDAWFDNFGELTATGYSDAMAKMAFAAMEQDVRDDFDMAPFQKAYDKANG